MNSKPLVYVSQRILTGKRSAEKDRLILQWLTFHWVSAFSPLKQRNCTSRISEDCISCQVSKTPEGLQKCGFFFFFFFNKPQTFPSYGGNYALGEKRDKIKTTVWSGYRLSVQLNVLIVWSHTNLQGCRWKRLRTLTDESRRGCSVCWAAEWETHVRCGRT